MKIEFKIITEENDLVVGKEKRRLISIIINKLCSASNTMLDRILELINRG